MTTYWCHVCLDENPNSLDHLEHEMSWEMDESCANCVHDIEDDHTEEDD